MFGLVGIIGFLMVLISFRWGYTEGKLEITEAMLEVVVEEEMRRMSND